MDRSPSQKIRKVHTLNDTLDQIDSVDIYRLFHLKAGEYTFSSSAHETFSRMDHILGYNSSLSKFQKIKIAWSIFSDHKTVRSEINYTRKRL